MASRFKTSFEKSFDVWLKKNYGQHHRRIVRGRSAARWALFSYPLGICLLCLLPVGAITAAVVFATRLYPERISEIIAPDRQELVFTGLYAVCGASALFGLILGVAVGIGRAGQMIYESERDEIQVRQTYYLQKMNARRKRRSRAGSPPPPPVALPHLEIRPRD